MLAALLPCLLAVSLATPLFFSFPYRTVFDHAGVQHLAKVEVNRYSYDIDFTLQSD
jgi:hypothetical protein